MQRSDSTPLSRTLIHLLAAAGLAANAPAWAVSFHNADDDGGTIPQQSFPGNSQDVAWGDLDGDGDVDAVVANDYFSKNSVWENNGSGKLTNSDSDGGTIPFQEFGYDAGANDPLSLDIALADLDGDGDLDAFVANGGSQPNTVWMNDGSGDFGTTPSHKLGSNISQAVALGDVDGDGDIDALVANGSENYVWKNDGSGAFTGNNQAFPDANTHDVALADVDGDGELDVFLANDEYDDSTVWTNKDGAFYDTSQSLVEGKDSRAVALGDLDGDGDPDAVVANENAATVVLENDGDANFLNDDDGNIPQQTLGSSDTQARDVALRDVDNDGDLDVLVAELNGPVTVWENDGTGRITHSDTDGGAIAAQSLGSAETQALALPDLDGDGQADLLEINSSSDASRVWENDGVGIRLRGALADDDQSLGSTDTNGVALADLNGDGARDALAVNDGANAVYTNDGSGTLKDSGALSLDNADSGRTGQDVAVADLDGDGDTDAVVANGGTAAHTVYTNDGDSTLSLTTVGDGDGRGVALGDLDRDGSPEALIATASSQQNRFLDNDGTGLGGGDSGAFGTHRTSRDVAIGDLNGDGDPDALFANNGANGVYNNTGNAAPFGAADQDLGSADSRAVALGDVDGDGDLDAVVANGGSTPANRLWLNQGGAQDGAPGVLKDSGQRLGDADSHDVRLVDLGDDGDLDILFANDGADTVWANDGSGGFGEIPAVATASTAATRALAPGDLDGDGITEALAARDGANAVYANVRPEVAFTQADYAVREADGEAAITVKRTSSDGPATVDYATTAETATAGSDYDTAYGTLRFADGEVEKAITVQIHDDSIAEEPETVGLELSRPSGMLMGGQDTATLTINNRNEPPRADDLSLFVNNGSSGTVTLSVSDPDDDSLSYQVGEEPDHGSLAQDWPEITYTPNDDYSGDDRFTVQVSDGKGGTDTATISVTVNAVNGGSTSSGGGGGCTVARGGGGDDGTLPILAGAALVGLLWRRRG